MSDRDQMHWLYALTPQWLVRRLLVPEGLIGRVAAHNMARINTEMNRTLVELLELRGDERALEIGFGPGVAIGLLLDTLPRGRVAGIDPSSVMLRMATRRNRRAVREGRAELRSGTVTCLPWADGSFDVACSANSVQIWEPLADALREVRRVLRPGGRFVVSTHEWAGERLGERVPEALVAAGFRGLQVRRALDRSGKTLHVLTVA